MILRDDKNWITYKTLFIYLFIIWIFKTFRPAGGTTGYNVMFRRQLARVWWVMLLGNVLVESAHLRTRLVGRVEIPGCPGYVKRLRLT